MAQLSSLLDQISDPPGMTGIPALQPMQLRDLLAQGIGTSTMPKNLYDRQRLLEYLQLMQRQQQAQPPQQIPQQQQVTPYQRWGMK